MIDGVEKKLNSISRFEQNYFYDNNNRLTKEEDIIIGSHEGAEFPTFYINRIHHTYDNNGNALTETFDSGSVDEYSKAFTYNKLGQLTGYSKDNVAVATYAYNAEGLRKSKTVGTETTEFYYYNGTIINEVKDNALYATNILGASGISQRKIGTDSAYFVKNGHGDTVKLVNAQGTEISDYEYDIWGKVESTTGTFDNPYRYTGEYYDEESGMIYLRNRYYNPDIQRFITEDPIKDGMNWYAYCSNNPIIYVDPLGLGPGNPFATPDEAAADFGFFINRESIAIEEEYAAFIYEAINEDGDICYYYDEPRNELTTHEERRITFRISLSKTADPKNHTHGSYRAVAVVHTHGAYDVNTGNMNDGFSTPQNVASGVAYNSDTYQSDKSGLNYYVVTPNGNLRKYIANSNNPTGEFIRADMGTDPAINVHQQMKGALLWGLLKICYPNATEQDFVDARLENPDNWVDAIKSLERFR